MIMRDSSAAICHRYEGGASREIEIERDMEGGRREGSADLLFGNPATDPPLHRPLAYSLT